MNSKVLYILLIYPFFGFAQSSNEALEIIGKDRWVVVDGPDLESSLPYHRYLEFDKKYEKRDYCACDSLIWLNPITVKNGRLFIGNSGPYDTLIRISEDTLVLQEGSVKWTYIKWHPIRRETQPRNDTANLFGLSNYEQRNRIRFLNTLEEDQKYKIQYFQDRCESCIAPFRDTIFSGLIFQDSNKLLRVLKVPFYFRNGVYKKRGEDRFGDLKNNIESINLAVFNEVIKHIGVKDHQKIVEKFFYLALDKLEENLCFYQIRSSKEYEKILYESSQIPNCKDSLPSEIKISYGPNDHEVARYYYTSEGLAKIKFLFSDQHILEIVELEVVSSCEMCDLIGNFRWVAVEDEIDNEFRWYLEKNTTYHRKGYCINQIIGASMPLKVVNGRVYVDVKGLDYKPWGTILKLVKDTLFISIDGHEVKFKKDDFSSFESNKQRNDTAQLFGISNDEFKNRIRFPKLFAKSNKSKIWFIYDRCEVHIQVFTLETDPCKIGYLEDSHYSGLLLEDSNSNICILKYPSNFSNPEEPVYISKDTLLFWERVINSVNFEAFYEYLKHVDELSNDSIASLFLNVALSQYNSNGCFRPINSYGEYMDLTLENDKNVIEQSKNLKKNRFLFDGNENSRKINKVYLKGKFLYHINFKFDKRNEIKKITVSLLEELL